MLSLALKKSLGWLTPVTVSYHELVNTAGTGCQSMSPALLPHGILSSDLGIQTFYGGAGCPFE